MGGIRAEVLDWLASGRVAPGRELDVLRSAHVIPSAEGWRHFLGQLTLWLGTVALAAAMIFFFAFNWDDLGRFAKLALVEAAILAGLLLFWRLDMDGMAGKATLLLLSLLAGALLALTGQIYQTGADTYQLFAWWAVLTLPWVLVGRFSPLWLLWLALLNLAVFLYFQRGFEADGLLWAMFGLNGLALIAWETGHRWGLEWLRDSWPPRLIAIGSGGFATALIVWAILDGGGSAAPAMLAYAAWLAAFYVWYRRRRPDLFMLASGVLSVVVAVATFLSKYMLDDAAGFLLIGLAVIGLSAGGAIWLKSVGREQGA